MKKQKNNTCYVKTDEFEEHCKKQNNEFKTLEGLGINNKKDNILVHAEVKAIKKQLVSVEGKIDAIYPKVKQDIDVAQAFETINKYSKGKAQNWIYWLRFAGLIGGFVAMLTAIKYFFMNK